MIEIIKVDKTYLDDIAPLFDAYRIFYGQNSDVPAARIFLTERMDKRESVLFLAHHKGIPAGFTQLYTTFSSVTLQPVYILNDLYVDVKYRKMGIGEALLEKGKTFCKSKGYKGLALETAIDNPAQKLYERLGWEKESHCFHYFWSAE
ncbi:GNAT family N-acetyltransferase [Maribacter halichondriae]|uniref:GNAT family N-acetyltransferase n=1 Tax=Maribacter halichondriae TaxID=2980554 RepID=UPI00235A4014|nr:GNAT family N-acetyltransferase [Maribacter sp. Hal144]